MNILQVNAFDDYGGAEKIAWNLFRGYRARGHATWLAVGQKRSDDPDVLRLENDAFRTTWARFWIRVSCLLAPFVGRVKGAGLIRNLLTYPVGQTRRWFEVRRGHEDFDFPATKHLLDLPPRRPDILHCHNLHGRYFDLRILPLLSAQLPTVVTLHDAWLLSGHCAHSFGCDLWRTGCGHCPDLAIPRAIRRDATAYNWRRKRQTYARSRLRVATPCHWLMKKVEQSMLALAIVEAKVIPNGVDLAVFRRTDGQRARKVLGIPQETKLLLSVAKGEPRNVWQDYQTMRDAVGFASERLRGRKLWMIVLGREQRPERVGSAEFHFLSSQKTPEILAFYYQAADIYLHPALGDTFPNAVLESLACGTPVVSTAVGGIPEQVKGFKATARRLQDDGSSSFGIEEATGILVPSGNESDMATAIEWLLKDDALRRRLGENAALDAHKRFDLNRQVETYLKWYQTIADSGGSGPSAL